ncbi:hypothetical protein V1227_05930 [Lentzea sp. DG1S-22]|uniref:hypothetical protein n=1 Tax=Lentzea sp. DG1S-22 TaxID=3108822 RepID=UPI002E77C757|nr:hypothetical protein [Lentzea sp. DG1S-22]WVH82297.1 hypothetical protein V1227_05930 [Lentzea sp. DG1S-22]
MHPDSTSARFDPEALRTVWTQVAADAPDALAVVAQSTGVDFATAAGRVWETDDFVYPPVVVNIRSGDTIPRSRRVRPQPRQTHHLAARQALRSVRQGHRQDPPHPETDRDPARE